MMKQFSLLLSGTLIFSLLFSTSLAQTPLKDLTEDGVKSLLCNNWKITVVEVEGQKILMPPERKGFMNFKKSGILSIYSDTNDIDNSNWTYVHKEYKIKTKSKDESDFFEIINISSTELVLLHTSEGYPVKIFLKRVV